MKNKLVNGYINIYEKEFVFTYNDNLLQLVPADKSNINPLFDYFKNKDSFEETIIGITQSNKSVIFLNCKLTRHNSGYIAKPAGYLVFDEEISTFKKVVFRGGVVDYFYRPNQVVHDNSYINYETGEGEILLKKYDDISKEFYLFINEKKYTVRLNITRGAVPNQFYENYNLGKVSSYIELESENELELFEFQYIYTKIHNFMMFVSFKKEICFEQIFIYDSSGRKSDLYLSKEVDNYNNFSDVDNIISYYHIEDKICNLINIVNNPKLNLLFIQENINSDKYVTTEQYMVLCSSFESTFSLVYPNARQNFLNEAKLVKDDLINYINNKEEECKGLDKKRRDEYKKYKSILEKVDFSLEERFRYCDKEFNGVLLEFKHILYNFYKINEIDKNNIASEFSRTRNNLVHSHINEFNNANLAAYLLARVFIYAMLLRKVEIDDSNIKQIVENIFLKS